MQIAKIEKLFELFKHLSIEEIGKKTNLNPTLISNKTSVSTLSNSMFKYCKIKMNDLKKQNILVKTVRLQENLKPKESMSFERVDFHNVINEQWETSFLKEKFSSTTFLFVVFQAYNDTFYFRGLYKWKMPVHTIENELQDFWYTLQAKLKNGVTLTKVVRGEKTVTLNDLPTTNDSTIMHIRPKAQNANDVTSLPDGQLITKQAYWINASYIADILAAMPPLQVTEQNSINHNEYTYKEFKHLLIDEIYTIDQFIEIARYIVPSFDKFHLTDSALKEVNYKLSPPYVMSIVFENATSYFHKNIFKNRYFEVPLNAVWQTYFVSRTLEKLENEYALFKIDNTTYLTKTALENANIKKETLQDYKNSVENYVAPQQFFTLASLRKSGFSHPIEDFGFETIFYESILKRPGRLHYLKVAGQIIFIKSPQKPSYGQLFSILFTDTTHLDLDELADKLYNHFSIKINYSDLEKFFKTIELTPLFYSSNLNTLFDSKNSFYDYIH